MQRERFCDDSKTLYFHTLALLLRRLVQVVMVFPPFRYMQILIREMAFIGLGDSRGCRKFLVRGFKTSG